MFDWITKPEIYWTFSDSLYSTIELALLGIINIILFHLIIKIIDFFSKKGGDN